MFLNQFDFCFDFNARLQTPEIYVLRHVMLCEH